MMLMIIFANEKLIDFERDFGASCENEIRKAKSLVYLSFKMSGDLAELYYKKREIKRK